jgi:CDGSH iron-sulfur domain-containing protein 3
MQEITRDPRDRREEIPMARMIRHERNAPYEVPEGTELPLYICACGLSKNKPFCDGSHKITRDENPSDVYVYDGNGKDRVRVVNQY